MDVTPLVREGAQIIQSYKNGRFKISGAVYESAVLVMPGQTQGWDAQADAKSLSEKDFEIIAPHAAELDVVLLGTGVSQVFFPPKIRDALKGKGLMVEAMDTGAACRTYNVLMAEGRRVAALLLPH
jgi:uncharacterized protein